MPPMSDPFVCYTCPLRVSTCIALGILVSSVDTVGEETPPAG